MEEKNKIYVYTEDDLWNSADEARFVLIKNQVKALPEIITPIIANALENGLLKEINGVDLEKAIQEDRLIE